MKTLLASAAIVAALTAPAKAGDIQQEFKEKDALICDTRGKCWPWIATDVVDCVYQVNYTDLPGGFLALREEPSSKSKMIAALGEGKMIAEANQTTDAKYAKNLKTWMRVRVYLNPDPDDVEPTYGWVNKKYIFLHHCLRAS